MRLLSLFAGIGGFDLAAHWMGWATAVMVEWEEFPRQVLIKNFNCVPAEDLSAAELTAIIDAWKVWRPGQAKPTTVLYGDICHFDATVWRGAIDLVCGGFPCQPYSGAGKKLGNDDPRALFPHMLRVVCECAARLVLGENVRGLLTISKGLAFESVCAGLEAEGYEVQPLLLPACGVGAPHQRDRFWFVANANGNHGGGTRPGGIVKTSKAAQRLGKAFSAAGESGRADELLCENRQHDGHEGLAPNAPCGRIRCGCPQGQPGQPTRYGKAGVVADADNGQSERQEQQVCAGRDAAGLCSEAVADTHSERQSQPEGHEPQLGGWTKHGGEEATADATGTMPQVGQVQRSHIGQEQPPTPGAAWRLTEPPLCSPDDGVPAGLVRTESGAAGLSSGKVKSKSKKDTGRADSLKGYGNAIVPQVAYQLFQAIEATTP